jgi:hypothetical protein
MNSSYTIHKENKVKAMSVSFWTFSRLFVLGFIEHNPAIFAGLCRLSTPFGGNILSGN